MSDSVDRVFVHALATVRRLPRTGSSRPPPSARLQLYGLYKQSMEGDVVSILPRPTLPVSSPDPSSLKANASAVHRYASRDLRTREAQAEIEKWDAWHACAGLSKTEAKRRYISTLIETMKEYASGTAESRELISELEFVWSQIRSQSGSSEGTGGAGEDRESPSRKLERSGLRQTTSYDSIRSPGPGGGTDLEPINSNTVSMQNIYDNGLRVLSPMSQEGMDGLVEGQEDSSLLPPINTTTGGLTSSPSNNQDLQNWRQRIESHLRHLSTEIAALREELASNQLLSSSTLSASPRGKLNLRKRIPTFFRWLFLSAFKHVATDLAILLLLIFWERYRRKRSRDDSTRIEDWVKRRWKDTAHWWERLRWWSASWFYLSGNSAVGLKLKNHHARSGSLGFW